MRRAVLSVLAAVAAIAAALVTAAVPAGAAGVVDLSAATVSSPAAVSPPGSLVFYTATFRNEGGLTVEGIFTDTTTNGTLYRAVTTPGCDGPAAGTADPVITCTATLAAGQSLSVEVIIRTPLTAPSSVTNAASARVNPGVVQVVDLATANNDSSVVTPVRATTGVGSAGFVQEGGTLTYKKHVLTVRDADLGVVAFLNDTVAPEQYTCGAVACKEGLHLDFDQDPRFFGTVAVDVDFGVDDPCRGLGSGAGCYSLYVRKTGDLQPIPVPACASAPAGVPCLESTYKTGNEFHAVVVMDTNDPDLLAPIKPLTSSTSG